MTELLAEREFARALSSAFVADLEAAPELREAIASGIIGPRRLRDMMVRAAESEASGYPGVPTFPNLRRLVRERIRLEGRIRSFGMGQDWVASMVGAIGAVANAAVAYTVGKDIAKAERERAQAIAAAAARQAELDAARERLAYSQQAKAEAGFPSGAGLPGWVLPAAAAAVVGGVLVLRG